MENATKNEISGPKRKKGETLKEKIHRHLNDKDDKITDEDIRNAIVGESAIPDIEEEGEKMAEEVPKDKKTTPWDILSED
jgi:hypothetical protein